MDRFENLADKFKKLKAYGVLLKFNGKTVTPEWLAGKVMKDRDNVHPYFSYTDYGNLSMLEYKLMAWYKGARGVRLFAGWYVLSACAESTFLLFLRVFLMFY